MLRQGSKYHRAEARPSGTTCPWQEAGDGYARDPLKRSVDGVVIAARWRGPTSSRGSENAIRGAVIPSRAADFSRHMMA